MKFTNRDIYDIDVDFAVRKIVTGAPETYTWKPEDDSKVREWLDETVEAESLMDARLDADSLPGFLIEANRVRKPAGRPTKAVTQFNLAYISPDATGRYITASVVDPDFTRDIDLPRGVRLLGFDTHGYPRVRFPSRRLLMGKVLDIGPLRK